MLADYDPDQIVTSQWVADRLGLSVNTIGWWRWTDQGPAYFKAGTRAVRYRRGDVEDWIRQRQAATAPGWGHRAR